MLSRFNLFEEIARLQDEVGRPFGLSGRAELHPAVDIYEEDNAVVLRADLPGVKEEDVQLELENNVLTVRGEKKLEREEKKEGVHRMERAYGTFSRSFALPDNVSTEQIDAEMKDGVLTIRLTKKPAEQPRRIALKGAKAGTTKTFGPKGTA